jgi:hypothetical protein
MIRSQSQIDFRGLMAIAARPVKRLMAQMELRSNVRTIELLQRQIGNDRRAIAYLQQEQALINSRIRELS